jgi:cAMP-dependent protein kinase regulator
VVRKDARALREEAATATADGKHRRALECYLELERLEPAEPNWPKRVAEICRRLGKLGDAITAYERTIDRYVRGGFLVQAIAVCKVILQIEPSHNAAQERLAEISEQQAAGQSRFGALADRHRSLHGVPSVEALRAAEGERRRGHPATLSPELPPDEPMRIERAVGVEEIIRAGADEPEPLPPVPVLRAGDRAATAPILPPTRGHTSPLATLTDPFAPPPEVFAAPPPAFVPPPDALAPAPAAFPPPEAFAPPPEAFAPPRVPPARATIPPVPEPPDPGAGRRRGRRITSGPVYLSPGAPLASVSLSTILQGADPAPRDDGSQSGILIIPIDEDPIYELSPTELVDADDDDTVELTGSGELPRTPTRAGAGASLEIPIDVAPAVEADAPVVRAPRAPTHDELVEIEEADDPVASVEIADADDDAADRHELSVEDLEEVGDRGMHGPISATARRALAATPLFSSLPAAALEELIDRIQLVDLAAGEVLFRQGDAGHNLYVVVEGAIHVWNEGPPRTRLLVLGPGSFFGEIALVTDHPRSATVEVEQATQLLSIDRDAVRALMRDHPDVLPVLLRFVRERLVDSLVRTHPMFAPFGDPDRRSLVGRFRFVEIEAGTVFVEQGARTGGLYVLMAGRARILRDGAAVAQLDSGDMVGETSVLGGGASPISVQADVRCLALFLPRADFHEIIMTHPQVLSYIGDLADERAREWAASSPSTMRVKMV